MANPFLSQILASVLGGAIGGRARGGPLGESMDGGGGPGMGGGGLGEVLGGMLGGRGAPPMGLPTGRDGAAGGGRSMLLALMLPLAMQWVQRNGGIGNVLQRFRQKGYTQQAASWVSTGDNQGIDAQAVGDVLGPDELSQLSRHLGVGQEEVASGFAEILPEMVNQLTPQGAVPHDADQTLDGGLSTLERMLAQSEPR